MIHFEIQDEITATLSDGGPVVALESTLITHGLPYPDNIATARNLENIIRAEGSVPATIAVIDGVIKIGLDDNALETIGNSGNIHKLNAADLPVCVTKGQSGGTTVAATMFCAHQCGIRVFATGGIGGVHRGAAESGDISQDLEAFARYNVAVVTSGAKAILDLPRTLEYLETSGVPVIGYGTDNLPAFWSRHSGLPLSWRSDTPDDAARIIHTRQTLGQTGGTIIANPIAAADEIPYEDVEAAIEQAVSEAKNQDITGKDVTPYLLKRVRTLTANASLAPNITLLENNARLGGQIAAELAALS